MSAYPCTFQCARVHVHHVRYTYVCMFLEPKLAATETGAQMPECPKS